MGKFENKFLSVLQEDDLPPGDGIDAVDAGPDDDAQSFAGSLDQPDNVEDFEDIKDNQPNTANELGQLQEWIDNIDEVVDYLNGGVDSVLGYLRTDNKTGTIFDGVSDATKAEILDVCERLASLNQIFKNLYIEKHK